MSGYFYNLLEMAIYSQNLCQPNLEFQKIALKQQPLIISNEFTVQTSVVPLLSAQARTPGRMSTVFELWDGVTRNATFLLHTYTSSIIWAQQLQLH